MQVDRKVRGQALILKIKIKYYNGAQDSWMDV